jgi:hypothetical protein
MTDLGMVPGSLNSQADFTNSGSQVRRRLLFLPVQLVARISVGQRVHG